MRIDVEQVSRYELATACGVAYEHSIYKRIGGGEIEALETISRISPYDETEYHWARRTINNDARPWTLRLGGSLMEVMLKDSSHESIADRLLELDVAKGLKRTGGIY